MEKTTEEKIQRLVNEELAKKKRDEENEKLMKEGIAKEKEKVKVNPIKGAVGVVLMVLASVILAGIIVAFVFSSTQQQIGTSTQTTRDAIFAKANDLNQKCNDARGTSKYIDICQKEIDYLYANREVLDSGKPKNWASDTITLLENAIKKIRTGGKTNGDTSGGTGNSEANIYINNLVNQLPPEARSELNRVAGSLSIAGDEGDIYVNGMYAGKGSAYFPYILPGQYTVTQINGKGERCWEKKIVVFAGKPSILKDNSWCR